MIDVEATSIPDVKIIRPKRFGDTRGFFSETYNERDFTKAGIDTKFIQDNESLSRSPGTIRGLHYQAPDHAQTKLVRVLSGALFDVAVDIRAGSPTYGRHVSVTLSSDNGDQLFIPKGFAHGFCTLEPNTRIFYKVDAYYSAEHDAGLIWNDPILNIHWPDLVQNATISDKDRLLPSFETFASPFRFRG
ncbi:MAG: dTDP-4-dehydrorhamnose 3,5-epimerase [Parvibaculum sp.]